jgi:hypothetical protein
MALVGALCITLNAVVGFTNRSLRAQVAGLLGTTYTSSQMTYDLRRLRRKGLIRRQPRSSTYTLTPDGIRVAVFYTKVYARLLRPLLAVDHPPSSPELRHALRVIDTHVVDSIHRSRLQTAAWKLDYSVKARGTKAPRQRSPTANAPRRREETVATGHGTFSQLPSSLNGEAVKQGAFESGW